MLTEYQKSIFQTLIHSPDLSDEAAGALLAVYRLYERTEIERQKLTRQLDKEEYTSRLAQSDRDNRRRRMDLARAILDETQVHDLDKVAAIIWPTSAFPGESVSVKCDLEIPGWGLNCERDINHSGPHYNQGMGSQHDPRNFDEVSETLASAPIDQPTRVIGPCGHVLLDGPNGKVIDVCALNTGHIGLHQDIAGQEWSDQAPYLFR